MMTEYEARKLSESMHNELNAGPRAVWQCIAGLLFVIGIVLAGAVFPPTVDRSLEVNAPAGSQAAAVTRSDLDARDHARAETQSRAGAARDSLPLISTSAPGTK
jgi:hypothetical protein